MPIKFKLVGQSNNKYYEITDNFEGKINLNLLQELFKFHGLDSEDIEKIRFITDSEQIKNSEKYYTIKTDEDRCIFVFTADQEVRIKLQQVFMKNGHSVNITSAKQEHCEEEKQVDAMPFSTEQFQPLTVKEEVVPDMTPEIIEAINKTTIQLFSQPDFKSLLSIYLTNPKMFTVFSKYVQHGDIIANNSESKWETLALEKQEEYNKLAEKLEEFNLGKPREYLLERLVKYSGHLNLTLRSILSE